MQGWNIGLPKYEDITQKLTGFGARALIKRRELGNTFTGRRHFNRWLKHAYSERRRKIIDLERKMRERISNHAVERDGQPSDQTTFSPHKALGMMGGPKPSGKPIEHGLK